MAAFPIMVVGLGSIGRRHFLNLGVLLEQPAIIAVDPCAQARDWARRHGAAAVSAQIGEGLDHRPRAALICTPSGQHLDGLRACVERQVHAYVEKPLATRLSPSLAACLDAAARAGCTVATAANMRYEPGAAALMGLVQSGQLGGLTGIHLHAGSRLTDWAPNRNGRDYRRSYSASAAEGGALLDFIHEFDLLRWWGGEVAEVSARVRQASELEIESEAIADVLVSFASGAAGTVHVDYLQRPPQRRFELLFSEGRACWDAIRQRVDMHGPSGDAVRLLDAADYDINESYCAAVRDFLLSIDAAQPSMSLPSGWDGAAAVAIVDAARASAAARTWVVPARVGLGVPWAIGPSSSAMHSAAVVGTTTAPRPSESFQGREDEHRVAAAGPRSTAAVQGSRVQQRAAAGSMAPAEGGLSQEGAGIDVADPVRSAARAGASARSRAASQVSVPAAEAVGLVGGAVALGLRRDRTARAEAAAAPPPPSGSAPASRPLRHPRSTELLARARGLIPAMTQTMSKGPSQFVQGVCPVYMQRGQGCRLWDVDGHEYIDWAMALGPVILGYCDPDVDAAVARQLAEGVVLSLMHPLEVETAELLAEVLPGAESVRFLKTGSGACAAAVRVARAYTGRDLIVSCGYHGWHDWSAGLLAARRGVPQAVRGLVEEFAYNDLDALRRCLQRHAGAVAAVFMEPMCAEWPREGFLEGARELAHAHGALFILDEVVTGFRWALGGAQEYFQVQADLAVYGKAMANGLPLAALAGRREVMAVLEEGAFVSTTHGGETLSLAAAKATIRKLRDTAAIPALWAQGRRLRQGLSALFNDQGLSAWFELVGPDCRFEVRPAARSGIEPLMIHSVLQQELVRRGIFFDGGHVLCAAHDDAAVQRTLAAYAEAAPVVAAALESGRPQDCLEGPAVQPVFRPRRVAAAR